MKIYNNKPLVRFIQGMSCLATGLAGLGWLFRKDNPHPLHINLLLIGAVVGVLFIFAGCVRLTQGFGAPIVTRKGNS